MELRESPKKAATGEVTKDIEIATVRDWPKGARTLYGSATAMIWPAPVLAQLEKNLEEEEHLENNEHFQGLATWIERYGYGCVTPTGEYVMAIAVASLDGFANHACNDSDWNVRGSWIGTETTEAWPVSDVRTKRRFCSSWTTQTPLPSGTPLQDDYRHFSGADLEEETAARAEYDGWCKGKTPFANTGR